MMGAMASQITSLTIVYSSVHSGTDQIKHQSSASLAFVQGIHRWPVNSPHKGPVTWKMSQFGDVFMSLHSKACTVCDQICMSSEFSAQAVNDDRNHIRPWARGVHHDPPPPPHPYKTMTRLQTIKLCIHDGPEIMFFMAVSCITTNNNPSHTVSVSNESSESILSICVSFSDAFIIKHVSNKNN